MMVLKEGVLVGNEKENTIYLQNNSNCYNVNVCIWFLPDTLADLMKDKVEEGHEYYTVYKTKVNGKYDIREVKISDPKGIEELWALLEETEVSFKKITRLPGLENGEVWYEITDMQHIRSIQIEDSGEVQTMAFHIT